MKPVLFRKPCLCAILTAALFMIQICFPVQAAQISTNANEGWPQGPEITCQTAVLYDADTHTVLYNKGMDDIRYPASTTKIMTALLAIENTSPDDIITMGENACTEVYWGSTNINSQVGETFTMDQCLHAILLASANEVSTQVAEYVAGSVDAFVDMMNQRAAEIGCTNTHFHNANGLTDDQHWTTAHDLALIMAECIKNETFLSVEKDLTYTIPSTNMTSEPRELQQHHVMMLEGDWFYDGVFAGKTGFTDEAGHTLVTACKRDGHTLICVVMGGSNPVYFTETASLLDYGYQNFSLVTPVTDHNLPLSFQVTVPASVGIDDLTYSDTAVDSSDPENVTYERGYYYNGNLMGAGMVTDEELNALNEEEKAVLAAKAKAKRIRNLILAGLVFLLIGAGLFVYKAKKDAEEARRRAARRRRKFEQNNKK